MREGNVGDVIGNDEVILKNQILAEIKIECDI